MASTTHGSASLTILWPHTYRAPIWCSTPEPVATSSVTRMNTASTAPAPPALAAVSARAQWTQCVGGMGVSSGARTGKAAVPRLSALGEAPLPDGHGRWQLHTLAVVHLQELLYAAGWYKRRSGLTRRHYTQVWHGLNHRLRASPTVA